MIDGGIGTRLYSISCDDSELRRKTPWLPLDPPAHVGPGLAEPS